MNQEKPHVSVPTESRRTEHNWKIQDRCAICGWTLAKSRNEGCIRGDCSQRPFPDKFHDFDRAEKEYGIKFDPKYRAASSSLLPVPEKLPKRAEDMEGLIGAVWAAHDEWKRLDARNQLSGECDYAEWLADAVLNHLRAGLPVGRQLEHLAEQLWVRRNNSMYPPIADEADFWQLVAKDALEIIGEPAQILEQQEAKRIDVLLDENCIATIKRLTPEGGEEISFGGVMGGIRLLWNGTSKPVQGCSKCAGFHEMFACQCKCHVASLPVGESTREKCGKPAAAFIPRLGQSFACVLAPNHEGECRPGGNCFKHGPYVGQSQIPPQCPKWPDCAEGLGESTRWISVEEKLPEQEVTYRHGDETWTSSTWHLCVEWDDDMAEFGHVIASYSDTKGWEAMGQTGPPNITHWQPLPKPPELGLGESREPLPAIELNDFSRSLAEMSLAPQGLPELRDGNPFSFPRTTPLAERDCTICGQQLKNCKCPSVPAEIESTGLKKCRKYAGFDLTCDKPEGHEGWCEATPKSYPDSERFLDQQPIDDLPHIYDGKWNYYRSDVVCQLLDKWFVPTRTQEKPSK